MHDPRFGLGIDTRVMLWHPCKVEVMEVRHNDVDWVDLRFTRRINMPDGHMGAWSEERAEVSVRREVARDLMCRLIELFPAECGRLTCKLSEVTIRGEEPCQSSATVEES